jgi:hypothetical protein
VFVRPKFAGTHSGAEHIFCRSHLNSLVCGVLIYKHIVPKVGTDVQIEENVRFRYWVLGMVD